MTRVMLVIDQAPLTQLVVSWNWTVTLGKQSLWGILFCFYGALWFP